MSWTLTPLLTLSSIQKEQIHHFHGLDRILFEIQQLAFLDIPSHSWCDSCKSGEDTF
ncbi:hypothetical protein BJ985_001544 [Corynebacterium tuberculostearicum]|nr:hypothetical protein [Corynebacterium tuberculostearicum]